MKILLITVSLFIASCDSKRPVIIPKVEMSQGIELKVKELGILIKTIDVEKISTKLSRQDASNFQKRYEDLTSNFNKTSSLIKSEYKEEEKDQLQLEYKKTKVLWDYIVFNYPI